MSARQMGFFTLAEWQKGLTEIQCDTIDKLQMKLASLNNLLDDQNIFKSIFRYAYDFARVSEERRYRVCPVLESPNFDAVLMSNKIRSNLKDKDQRSMDIETAKAMLQLLLGQVWHMYPHFAEFLHQSKYRVINKDQWCNILEFSRTISDDLINYDVDGACK